MIFKIDLPIEKVYLICLDSTVVAVGNPFNITTISIEDTTESKIYFKNAVMCIYSSPTQNAKYKLRLSDNSTELIQTGSWRLRPRVTYEDLELFFSDFYFTFDGTTGLPVFNNVSIDYNFTVELIWV